MAIGEDEGGKKKERQVVQKNGVVEDDDGIEDVRGAASFLGKKLFGERFSGRVNEKGQQQEGDVLHPDGRGDEDATPGEGAYGCKF